MNGTSSDMNYTGIIAARIPWWGKIAAKCVMARVPADYGFWKRLGLFQKGAMEDSAYAYRIFRAHFDRVQSLGLHNGFVGLELGPGDSLLSAVVAYAFGASRYYLVDDGMFARADFKAYRSTAEYLQSLGLTAPNVQDAGSLQAILDACAATYVTGGLGSLRAIPDESIDFIWSNAVLEHLKRSEFPETMRQLRRILRTNGFCSHQVDLSDHLGGALNHLRFSETLWESRFMSGSGFYTNRIRFSEMLNLFKNTGFAVEATYVTRWAALPTPQSKVWSGFRDLPEDELRVSGFQAILSPA